MAQHVKLNAEKREAVGRSANRKLRSLDLVPAVIYGAHCEPENLQLQRKPLENLMNHATNEHMLVDLQLEGGKSRPALIQSVQHDPITTSILHVDLLEVSMKEKITSAVPLEATGEPLGVKNQGGILEVLTRELDIECLPNDLPDVIHFDVSELKVGDSLHVNQLKLPNGVTALSDSEQAVALVAEPTVAVESEDEEAQGAGAKEPEVLNEKSDDENKEEKES